MSVKREQILQRYCDEMELTPDQQTIFCCRVELIPTQILADPYIYEDLSKGMTPRAAARKWGITRMRAWRISQAIAQQ